MVMSHRQDKRAAAAAHLRLLLHNNDRNRLTTMGTSHNIPVNCMMRLKYSVSMVSEESEVITFAIYIVLPNRFANRNYAPTPMLALPDDLSCPHHQSGWRWSRLLNRRHLQTKPHKLRQLIIIYREEDVSNP